MIKRVLFSGVLFLFTPMASSLSEPSSFPGIDIDKKQLEEWLDSYKRNDNQIDEILGFDAQRKKNITHVNSLIDSVSPYLLRHAFNPIAWREWSPVALDDANKQGKLIFLSIGYSSCHWCHVMEMESFADETLAATINQSFIPIKVDKEVNPQLNHRYTLALELMTGSSGWPITAVLTPKGDVVYINAYVNKHELNDVLQRFSVNWKKRPQFFEQSASLFMEQVDQLTSLSGGLQLVNLQSLEVAFSKLESRLDNKYGGFSGPVKFPEPALLNVLLDRYQRQPDNDLRQFLILSLDKLYQGNLYDQVHGGFYRYSTDPQYREPHFEKMLYTQAHIISVFSKAYSVLNDDKYLAIAKDTLGFVERWFLANDNLFYSAVDADYDHLEGGYYLWTRGQKAKFESEFGTVSNWIKIGDKYLPEFPLTEKQSIALRKYTEEVRYPDRPFIDKKVIVAWNAVLAQGLVQLFEVTQDEQYLTRAISVANMLWDKAWDKTRKRLNRILLYGRTEDDFNPEDSIELALLSLSIFELTQNSAFRERAVQLFESIEANGFSQQSRSSKQYSLEDLEEMIANDGEGYSLLVRFTYLLKQLSSSSKTLPWSHKYEQLKQVVATRLNQNPAARISAYNLLSDDLKGEIKHRHFFAGGKGFVSILKDKDNYLLRVELDDEWHVNSRFPLRKELIATEVKIYHGTTIVSAELKYPQATRKIMTFSKLPLSLYDGDFDIHLNNIDSESSNLLVELTVQACNDKICLLPERLLFPIYEL